MALVRYDGSVAMRTIHRHRFGSRCDRTTGACRPTAFRARSVAGQDGSAVEWLALGGPSDLPCFVERSGFYLKGAIRGTVRMETPVLYFYAPTETTVDVNVRFRSGVITEWFPHAAVPLNNAAFSSDDAAAAMRLNAFQSAA